MNSPLRAYLDREVEIDIAYGAYVEWKKDRDQEMLDIAVDALLPLVGTIFRSEIARLYRRHGIEDDGEAIAVGVDRMYRFLQRRQFCCTRCGNNEPRHFVSYLRHTVQKAMRANFYLVGRQVYDFGTAGEYLPYGRVRSHTDVANYLTLLNLDRIILTRVVPKIRFAGSERQRVIDVMSTILRGETPHYRRTDPMAKFFVDYAYILITNEMYLLRSSRELTDEDPYEYLQGPEDDADPSTW